MAEHTKSHHGFPDSRIRFLLLDDKMKVAFEAQIMQNNIKSLRSLDKEARLLLEYSAEDDKLVSDINKLHKADKTVMIVIMDKKK